MDLTWIWRSLWDSLPLPAIDWFWLDFAGYVGIVAVILLALWFLSRFLQDDSPLKTIALLIATGGLSWLWGYWTRRQDEQKRAAAAAAKKKPVVTPAKRPDDWWTWRQP